MSKALQKQAQDRVNHAAAKLVAEYHGSEGSAVDTLDNVDSSTIDDLRKAVEFKNSLEEAMAATPATATRSRKRKAKAGE